MSTASPDALPPVWFSKNISPTLQRIRQVKRSGRYRVLASHTSPDAGYLGAADHGFVEPAMPSAAAYLKYVLQTVREHNIAALVAGRYAAHLAQHRAEIGAAGCRLIVPSTDPASFERCEDKAHFYQTFAEHIPMPETRPVHNWPEMLAAARELEAEYGSACIKPARGIFGIGFRILTEGDDLKYFLSGNPLRLSYPAAELLFKDQELPVMLVMETLPGFEYSIDALARGGELLTCVIRRKLVGLGNLQTAVEHPQMREWTALLCRELQMDGLFNAQFREDKHGQPKLLEVNARASGGLPISAALSGLELGLLEVDSHFGVPLGDLTFAAGRRVTESQEVIALPAKAL
ncbi:ATP-grasp domain-containing protein [Deinococcus detaillensis]|uniref:ATP-grasp domain-containing protein n=1 Tax=Deinococcus detaillensis TaxID=2592048 RepID=A0A553UMD8_9DEIO|nr:ATP-grasp domain-containing protein [Deinococcus detaillensis]TSA81382.1 ATP-grasp domain-containing protein [Deinococcus detaillensis]